ncbi:MAG: hypothetical protein AMXMBFR60_21360 [Chloroflexota bacterium]
MPDSPPTPFLRRRLFPPTRADALPPSDSDTTDGNPPHPNPYIHADRHADGDADHRSLRQRIDLP